MGERGTLGVVRGAALYVGALIGPGVLLVPALAAQAAGAASIVAWAALLVVSAPLAVVFAALGVRHPVAGGVSAYVREGFGEDAAALTGGWFIAAVFCGAPAVALIGGYYVADLTGSGTPVAATVGLLMFGTVLATNAFGLRISSGFQLVLASVLVAVLALAVSVALPSRAADNWHPFAPHGWWAVGTAANILVWLFVGWEAVAQLAGDFRRPDVDLPLATEGALPRTLAGDAQRSIPRRPLVLIGLVGLPMLAALLAGFASTGALVRSTSACFIAVYVLALASGVRILDGRVRVLALVTLVLTVILAVFSAWYLLVPAIAGTAAVALRRGLRVADDDAVAVQPHDGGPGDFVVLTGLDPEPVEPAGTPDAERHNR